MADLEFLNQGEVHEDRDAVVAEWVGYAEAVAPPHWVWVGSCSQFQKKNWIWCLEMAYILFHSGALIINWKDLLLQFCRRTLRLHELGRHSSQFDQLLCHIAERYSEREMLYSYHNHHSSSGLICELVGSSIRTQNTNKIQNKCIGDDMKAAARQSPNCIKKTIK